jgi:hypothetical protein
MATGLVATGLSVALAPITFGGSLVWGAQVAALTALTAANTIEREQNGDLEINNGKTSINLRDELNRTNGLSLKSDSETRELEARVEQSIPRYDESCRIM